MIENEYLDAIKYILNKLKEIEASDIIEDITQVIAGKVPEQEELYISNRLEKEFRNISTQRLRDLTGEEKYKATVEILENYINTTPKVFNKVAGLFNTYLDKLRWEYDKSDDLITQEDNFPGYLNFNISPEDEIRIEKSILTLKAFTERG